MLEVEGLVTTYGAVRALDGVSLSAAEGSVTAILGANGAGKTTLLRTIGGLRRSVAGRVRLRGRDITTTPVERLVRLGLGHVPAGGGVISQITVAENLRLGALWRSDRTDRSRALAEIYAQFPSLAQRRNRSASTLSGGERQLLAIGRALMGRPSLLLLDEPSLGLAPLVTAQIMTLIGELRERTGLTVVLVEQNARCALAVADHGIVLNLGRVVAADDAHRLATDETLRHAYLGF